jgi:Pvc16 N-terminal domain
VSNPDAIAAVTATLRSLLFQGLKDGFSGIDVTIRPLDKARPDNETNNRVNLFLYQVVRSAAWVNADMPRQVAPGEIGNPPLPLDLFYLITAYGEANDATKPSGHELLGAAMSILHDHPILSADEIRTATQGPLPNSDLDRQIERVRLTHHPISLDELSKLWTGFATPYRLSAAYQAAVVLIESKRPTRSGLPVLTRGRDDSGVTAQGDLSPPLPTLEAVTPSRNQPIARLGEEIVLSGFHLDGTSVSVRFEHPLLTAPILLPPAAGGTARELKVTIPNQPANWPAGLYKVSVLVTRVGETFERTTNALAIPLAPSATVAAAGAAPGPVTLTATCAPEVRPGQRATILIGSSEFMANPHPAQTNTLTFTVNEIVAGTYRYRIRVDGVDSLLVDRSVTPPVFDETQKVVIT